MAGEVGVGASDGGAEGGEGARVGFVVSGVLVADAGEDGVERGELGVERRFLVGDEGEGRGVDGAGGGLEGGGLLVCGLCVCGGSMTCLLCKEGGERGMRKRSTYGPVLLYCCFHAFS